MSAAQIVEISAESPDGFQAAIEEGLRRASKTLKHIQRIVWKGGSMSHVLTDDVRRCADECSSCEDVCSETVNHCLSLGGMHAGAAHMAALLDCAAACGLTASFMLRGSAIRSHACELCADACDRCADSCDPIAGGDALMGRCAEECRRCAESCRTMSGVRNAGRSESTRQD